MPSNAIQVEMSVNWFKGQLAVNKATPTITWATPAPISTGTALSATQLNATASAPGSFTYNPAVGAVLAVGTQQLTAAFSPTDTTNYSSISAHTSVVVASTSGPVGPPAPAPPTPGPTRPADVSSLRARALLRFRQQLTRRQVTPAPHRRPARCYLVREVTPSLRRYQSPVQPHR